MTDQMTTLRVDFVSESAAYENTFGWYNSVTGMGGILFADVEQDGRNAPLTPGVSSTTFTVKTSDLANIQFFLIPDGYNRNSDDPDDLTGAVKVIQLADGTWAVADVDAYGNVKTRYGRPDILDGAGANALFTETSKNAGHVDYASSVVGSNQTAATLAGDTADGVTGTIAWEDIAATRNWNGTYSKPGDADYNDAVFRISTVNANHAPTAVADTASATEAGGVNNGTPGVDPTGNVLTNDTDPDAGDTKTVTTTGTFAGAHGTLTLNADGSYSYVVNNSDAAVNALRTATDTLTDTFNYTMRDTAGATSSSTLTVTIHGANDAPAAVADTNAGDTVVESGVAVGGNTFFAGDPSASGNVLTNDTDVDSGDTKTVTTTGTFTGTYGTLTLGANGAWSYALDNADPDTQALAQGESASDVFSYTMADAAGATSSASLTINISGTNDKPVITGGPTTGSVKEDTNNQATGQLNVTDPDHGAALTWTVVGGTPSTTADYHFRADSFSVTKSGGTITVLQDDFNDGLPPPNSPPLNPGGPNQQSTTYGGIGTFTESGGKLFFDSNNATSFVGVGTNDPIIGQDAIVRTNVDSNPTGLGLKIGSQFTIKGVFDLVLPDSPREAYGIRATDRLLNPVTNADSTVTPAQLGDNTFELVVRQNTSGQDVVSLRHLDFNTNLTTNLQNFTLTPPAGADQILLKLDHATNSTDLIASFQYMSGGALIGAAQTFSVTAPVFAPGSADTEVWTRAEIVAYAPQFTDSILGGSFGTLDVGQSGSWTYALNNALASTQSLSEGQHATDTFTVQVADQFGATDSRVINVDVVGTNDAPVIQPPFPVSPVLAEHSAPTLASSGFINFSDVDLADTHAVSASLFTATWSGGPILPPGLLPSLQNGLTTTLVDPATTDGHGQYRWDFALADNAVQFLGAGETLTLTYQTVVTDSSPFAGSHATATQNVTITITGTNDAPSLAADASGPHSVNELTGVTGSPVADVATGLLTFTDPDLNDHHSASMTLASAVWSGGATLPGGLTAALGSAVNTLVTPDSTGTGSGTVTFGFGPADSNFDFLAAGETLTVTYNLSVSDGLASSLQPVMIVVNGRNDAPVAVDDSNSADPVVASGVNPGNTPFPGDPCASGNVLTNDTDPDANDTKTVVAVNGQAGNVGAVLTGTYGTLTLGANGQWTYTLDNTDADTLALAQNETATETFAYTMADAAGATSSATLRINITGTNNQPTVSGPNAASFTEDALPLWSSGQLSASDVDHGATQTWSIVGGSPAAQDYNFALDEFKITRNGNPFFDDTFGDGISPPSAPNIIGGGPVGYGVGPSGAAFFEADGRALLVGAPNGALSPLAINGFQAVGQSATLQTDNTDNLNGAGLKKDMTFTVDGRFDLAIPTDVRDQYGIRLSDNNSSNTGDNTVSLTVRRDADGVHVTLSEIDFLHATSSVLQQIDLNPAAGDDQIVLHLTHATALSTDVSASFDLLQNGVVTSTTAFSALGHVFDNESWVQAQFVANGLPENDSVLQGTYSTLTVDQSGEWTARIRNGQAAVQALAQGETATETFNVQVTDDQGASAVRPVTVTVTGVNDAPVITGGATSGSVTEDAPTSQVTGQLIATDADHFATRSWTVAGGTGAANADYHFRADSFSIVKGSTVVLQDDFSDGNPPPSSPGSPQYVVTGGFTESGGKLNIDSNNAVSVVNVGNPDPLVGNVAIARTDIDPSTTNGLKLATNFTITGVFDLIAPDSPREAYGIRVTDRLIGGSGTPPDQLGDNTYDLIVRENQAGANLVTLRHVDFAANVTTNVQNFTLAPPSGADQIKLMLNHVANSSDVTASFQYLNHGAVVGGQNFSVTAPIFAPGFADTEVWTRAAIVTYAPATSDSLLSGQYGTLNVDQTGTWVYTLDNSRVVTQNLAQGQHATDSFTVKVADQFGASDSRVINIDVVGSNDAPVIQTPAETRSLTENGLPLGATGLAQFSDADLADSHTFTTAVSTTTTGGAVVTPGLAAALQNALTTNPFDPSTGDGHGQYQWNFNVSNADVQYLNAGQSVTANYVITVTDSSPSHATATQSVSITINGSGAGGGGGGPLSFITLDEPGAPYTVAQDINNYGEIVGQAGLPSGNYAGFDYSGGAFSPVAIAGATNTSANTINNNGLVGGWYEPFSSTPRYGFTELNGSYTLPIDLAPNTSTTVDGINDSGTFVGSSYLGGTTFRGYIDAGGVVTFLNAPGASSTNANGINNGGNVVGSYTVGSTTHGFLYQAGVYTTVDDPLGTSTVAADINSAGQIAGWYTDAGGHNHGFVDTGGVFTTIDIPAGVNGTFVRGINDSGQVVGWYTDAANVRHGFVAAINGGQIVQGTPSDDFLNGSPQGDMIIGLGGNDQIGGQQGNDVIDGGAGIDAAIYSQPAANYTITHFGTHVMVSGGTEGLDTLTNVELLNFQDAYVMATNSVDISQLAPFTWLVGGHKMIGTDGGDFLTVGTNVNILGQIDLGDGLDNLFLNQAGPYSLNLTNVEQVFGISGGDETVTLANPLNQTFQFTFVGDGVAVVNLGAGNDTLNLADGTNRVRVADIETVRGGSGNDTIKVESAQQGATMTGGGGADYFDLSLSGFIHNQPITFQYQSASDSPVGGGDTIDGFNANLDWLDLHALGGVSAWDVTGGVFHATTASGMIEIALPNLHGTFDGSHILA